ncbi:1-aminocyclopropane-1-carboxylate deaminase/D-cysteine desulfhydrase [Pedobacter sp. MW01-1-1]|uniref:1-aminocyclopropane-1-carboxylate deaminase/D-cysteine desulfhydrase n=1 Tax=Pedobacter sp. MW01-1-1 TaxID=3383027 RepID=UPI003FED43D0
MHLPPFKSLYIKRDDLIDPYISGNKWRKLKYLLKSAAEKKKNHLVTFGGAYSNHLLATAAATAKTGLKATAFVRGDEVENETLLLCKLYGMELIFTEREQYKNKQALFDAYFTKNPNAFFIDEGGASDEAIEGCSEIIDELPEVYDYIFCAAGTGTTGAGLLKGLLKHVLPTQLHIIPALKGATFIQDEIVKCIGTEKNLHVHLDYHFGGYAKTTPELFQFIQFFSKQTGVLIDPVYTAKMFYAIHDLQKKGEIAADAKILALHTGGLMGIFGMKDKFNF